MRIDCHVGTWGAGLALPARWLQEGAYRLATNLSDASQRATGPPGVELSVKNPRAFGGPGTTRSPDTGTLNDVLEEMLGFAEHGPVRRIGLLFTGRHSADQKALDHGVDAPTLFGLLLDPGFDPQSAFERVPREGCVVYLDTIAGRRAPGPDFEAEVLFTAIHEVGHVFNLWHAGTQSFMFRSATLGQALPQNLWVFTEEHERFLRDCPDSRYVQPGGKPFGERGTLGPSDTNLQNAPRSKAALRLHIGMQPREFWHFEPVELDVRLSVARGRARVPHELDAGYRRFQIWIEEPGGARRRYRAPLRYCGGGGSLRIEPGRPFERDISLFGQSGGYTFRRTGRHRIQAFFELPGGAVLRSNRIEVEVLRQGRGAAYDRLAKTLTDRRTARLLFYRRTDRLGSWTEDLRRFALRHKNSHVGARLLYSLGRAHLAAGRRAASRGHSAERRRSGQQLLERAAQLEALSSHQRRVARRLLDTE